MSAAAPSVTPLRRSARTSPAKSLRSVASSLADDGDHTVSSLGWLHQLDGRSTLSFGGGDDRRATIGSLPSRRGTIGGLDSVLGVLEPNTPASSAKPLKSCMKSKTKARKLSVAFGTPQGMYYNEKGPVSEKMIPMALDLVADDNNRFAGSDEDAATQLNSRILEDAEQRLPDSSSKRRRTIGSAAARRRSMFPGLDALAEEAEEPAAATAAVAGTYKAPSPIRHERPELVAPSPPMDDDATASFPPRLSEIARSSDAFSFFQNRDMDNDQDGNDTVTREQSSPTTMNPPELVDIAGLAGVSGLVMPTSLGRHQSSKKNHIVAAAANDENDENEEDDVTRQDPPRLSELAETCENRPSLDLGSTNTLQRIPGRSPTMVNPPRLSEIVRAMDGSSNNQNDKEADTFFSKNEAQPPRLSEIVRGFDASIGASRPSLDLHAEAPLESGRSPTMEHPPRLSEIARGGVSELDLSDEANDEDDRPSLDLAQGFAESARSPTMDHPPPRLSEIARDVADSPEQSPEPTAPQDEEEDDTVAPHRLSAIARTVAPESPIAPLALVSNPLATLLNSCSPAFARMQPASSLGFARSPLAAPVQQTIGDCIASHFGPPAKLPSSTSMAPLSLSTSSMPSADDVVVATTEQPQARMRQFIVDELRKAAQNNVLDSAGLACTWVTDPSSRMRDDSGAYADAATRLSQADVMHWLAQAQDRTLDLMERSKVKLEDDAATLREWTRLAETAAANAQAESARLSAIEYSLVRAKELEELVQSRKATLEALQGERALVVAESAQVASDKARVASTVAVQQTASLERMEATTDLAMVNLGILQALLAWRVTEVTADAVRVRTERGVDATVSFDNGGKITSVEVHDDSGVATARDMLARLVGQSVMAAGPVFDGL